MHAHFLLSALAAAATRRALPCHASLRLAPFRSVPSSSWHVLIDTGSSCLGLPAEFYDMVISWLPLRCNLGRYDALPNVCYITEDVRPVLPTLSFKLADVRAPYTCACLRLRLLSARVQPCVGRACSLAVREGGREGREALSAAMQCVSRCSVWRFVWRGAAHCS